jgi:hypothetical protein
VKPYSLNEHDLNFAGIDLDDDRGKVTLKPVGERFTFRSGVDGATTMSEDKGKDNFTAEVELGYGSTANAKLSAFYNLARASGGGTAGVAPFALKDRQGTSLVLTLEAVLVGWPDQERAAEVGTITWKFFLKQPTVFVGGLAG